MSTEAYIDSATAAIVQPMIDARDERIAEMERLVASLQAEITELKKEKQNE